MSHLYQHRARFHRMNRKALDQCVVASEWGPDQAASWWEAIVVQPPEVPVEKSPVDATMDYQPSEP